MILFLLLLACDTRPPAERYCDSAKDYAADMCACDGPNADKWCDPSAVEEGIAWACDLSWEVTACQADASDAEKACYVAEECDGADDSECVFAAYDEWERCDGE